MNPSYVRIRLPLADAMARYSAWVAVAAVGPAVEVSLADAVRLACDEHGRWLGSALFVYHCDGWTVFEDLSGHHGAVSAQGWRSLAGDEPLVYAGYNDAIGYGALVVVEHGEVPREYLCDTSDPSANVDRGELPPHRGRPVQAWTDVAGFVEDDVLVASPPARGLLWLHVRGPSAGWHGQG